MLVVKNVKWNFNLTFNIRPCNWENEVPRTVIRAFMIQRIHKRQQRGVFLKRKLTGIYALNFKLQVSETHSYIQIAMFPDSSLFHWKGSLLVLTLLKCCVVTVDTSVFQEPKSVGNSSFRLGWSGWESPLYFLLKPNFFTYRKFRFTTFWRKLHDTKCFCSWELGLLAMP